MIKCLSLFLISLCFCFSAVSQTDTEIQKIGTDVLNAFKNNKYNSLEVYLPTIQDLEESIEKCASHYPVEKQREMISKKNENAKKAIQKMYETFNSSYQQGVSAGINWSSVKLASVVSEKIVDKDIPKDFATGVQVSFTYLGVQYNVSFTLVKLTRGVVLFDRFKFY